LTEDDENVIINYMIYFFKNIRRKK